MSLPEQLSLSISLQDDATFSNYWVSPSNQIPVKALSLFCKGEGEQSLLLWGFGGCGLTHLLQACLHKSCVPVAYLPLKDALDLNPNEVCANLERAALVCVDDVETLAGNAQWELAFFHLYNRLRDNGHRLLMASHINPSAIALTLPDLQSRLLGSVIYRVDSLSQEEKIQALQMRAKVRGIKISADVARFIIKRAPTRMKKMLTILEQLDNGSLRLQKKLSVRLAKQILDESA